MQDTSQDLPKDRSVQKLWDEPRSSLRYEGLLQNGNSEEKAILLSTSSEDSSAWVHAVPISSLGLKLENSSFKIACGLRIGAKICVPYRCICGAQVDPFGRHGLHCQKACGHLSRHNEATLIIKKAIFLK